MTERRSRDDERRVIGGERRPEEGESVQTTPISEGPDRVRYRAPESAKITNGPSQLCAAQHQRGED